MYTNRTCTVGSYQERKEESKAIDLTIGVFFDGTGNNKYNIDWGARQKVVDDSYSGAYTNVALLWKAYENGYKNMAKVYVEGPGTYSPKKTSQNSSTDEKKLADDEGLVSSRKSDNSKGEAFGNNETGIHAKISRACDLIRTKVIEICQKQSKPVKTVTLDVSGFSRGAAAARCFVSNLLILQDGVNAKYSVCLREHLHAFSSTRKFLFKKTAYDRFLKKVEIKVRFMGLFDTVSSYSPSFSVSPNFENDVNELHLKIPKLFPTVEKVIHLVAADEYRENFALTDISSALGKGREIILPGAHSDIGGGYKCKEVENIYMSDLIFSEPGEHKTGYRECRGYMSLQELMDDKWLPMNWSAPIRSWDKNGKIVTTYNRTRTVYNTYARIPLYVMYLQTQKKSLPLRAIHINRITFIDNKETELLNLKNMLVKKIMNGGRLYSMLNITNRKTGRFIKKIITFTGTEKEKQVIESVRYRFIHLSARSTRSWIILHPHKTTKDNLREIIRG